MWGEGCYTNPRGEVVIGAPDGSSIRLNNLIPADGGSAAEVIERDLATKAKLDQHASKYPDAYIMLVSACHPKEKLLAGYNAKTGLLTLLCAACKATVMHVRPHDEA